MNNSNEQRRIPRLVNINKAGYQEYDKLINIFDVSAVLPSDFDPRKTIVVLANGERVVCNQSVWEVQRIVNTALKEAEEAPQ